MPASARRNTDFPAPFLPNNGIIPGFSICRFALESNSDCFGKPREIFSRCNNIFGYKNEKFGW